MCVPRGHITTPQQPKFCFWPEAATTGCPSSWFLRLQDRECLCFEEGTFNAHLFSTKICQDHILQQGLVSFAISPGKKRCMNIVLGPGWCGSVGWASSCNVKCRLFSSRLGHMPGLWAWSPVGARAMFLSHISISHPLFLPPFSSL